MIKKAKNKEPKKVIPEEKMRAETIEIVKRARMLRKRVLQKKATDLEISYTLKRIIELASKEYVQQENFVEEVKKFEKNIHEGDPFAQLDHLITKFV